MLNIPSEVVTNILLGASSIGLGIWAVVERWSRFKLQNANNDANVAVAGAQETMFTMLTGRLETLEKEVQGLRAELSIERQHSRKLEIHIYKLEDMMRKSNIEPPAFSDKN